MTRHFLKRSPPSHKQLVDCLRGYFEVELADSAANEGIHLIRSAACSHYGGAVRGLQARDQSRRGHGEHTDRAERVLCAVRARAGASGVFGWAAGVEERLLEQMLQSFQAKGGNVAQSLHIHMEKSPCQTG